jgi:hypothetical protein
MNLYCRLILFKNLKVFIKSISLTWEHRILLTLLAAVIELEKGTRSGRVSDTNEQSDPTKTTEL